MTGQALKSGILIESINRILCFEFQALDGSQFKIAHSRQLHFIIVHREDVFAIGQTWSIKTGNMLVEIFVAILIIRRIESRPQIADTRQRMVLIVGVVFYIFQRKSHIHPGTQPIIDFRVEVHFTRIAVIL